MIPREPEWVLLALGHLLHSNPAASDQDLVPLRRRSALVYVLETLLQVVGELVVVLVVEVGWSYLLVASIASLHWPGVILKQNSLLLARSVWPKRAGLWAQWLRGFIQITERVRVLFASVEHSSDCAALGRLNVGRFDLGGRICPSDLGREFGAWLGIGLYSVSKLCLYFWGLHSHLHLLQVLVDGRQLSLDGTKVGLINHEDSSHWVRLAHYLVLVKTAVIFEAGILL